MQIDSLVLRMRPRTPLEAADLGVRLCQSVARQVYSCYWGIGLPVAALALSTFELAGWLPALLIWWTKPWLDRTILFVLSRAAFGQHTTLNDVWNAQRYVWWGQLLPTLTTRRLSPWRSFTQPVYQLEGLRLLQARQRVLQIRSGKTSPATLMTSAFATTETMLTVALISLLFWLVPALPVPQKIFSSESSTVIAMSAAVAYALAVLFLEPFYVAAGFAMYLNRRAQLEAWDIEQELRRAFPQ